MRLYKTHFYFLLIVLVVSACSDADNSDSALLAKDKLDLALHLKTDKVSMYKFGKIIIRASVANENASPEMESFQSEINTVSKKLTKKENLTVLDYISIYRTYSKMQSFIEKTDEDIYPTLVEALNVAYGDSTKTEPIFSKGKEKLEAQNIEHAILSTVVLLSQDLGKEVALYECSKTNPKVLPDSEIRTLLQFIRGFLFFEKKLLYLSEDEITDNINWLNKNPDVELPYTNAFFQWRNLDNEQTHVAFHSFNHLFRGFDRLMMEREVDEERALQDFEVFLVDSKKLGLENEVVWSVECYLHIKKGDKIKAIAALEKLKTSKLLSTNDKKTLDQSIAYLQSRDNEGKLTGVYDKVFLSKIATKYMFSILKQINWKEVLEKQNVPHTKEMFEMVDKLKNLNSNLEKYSDPKTIKESGIDLFNKAKSLTD